MATGQTANDKNGMNDTHEFEAIRSAVFRIEAKFDTLNQMYVTLSEFRPFATSVEKRLDAIDRLKETGTQAWLDEREKTARQIQESEQRLLLNQSKILEKMDEREERQSNQLQDVKKESQSFKVLVLINIIFALIVPVAMLIVSYLMNHPK